MAKVTRRELMKRTAIGAGALGASALTGAGLTGSKFGIPYIMAADEKRGKLRTAVIGCGNQGRNAHIPSAADERLVAIVDADDNNLNEALKRAKATRPDTDIDAIQKFTDYRTFFDKMKGEVDAVFVVTPNHHHALPSLMAMERGIGVYTEKPLCYDMHEAKLMAEYANKYKVATQMGNQGHSGEGYRRLCEYIWAGAIGNVTEVYSWTDRANGGTGKRPPVLPVPANLHWDNWIGPAPYREYHKDLHPHEWHNWHDFGNGSLGNMGCHVLDGAMWALQLEQPTAIEVEYMLGGNTEQYPVGTRIRWDYPARGEMPPVKVWWYDGKKPGALKEGTPGDYGDSVGKGEQNWPPIVEELKKKYNRPFDSNGTVYIGDKGIMYTATYGGGVRIIPEEQHKATPVPEKVLPRIIGTHQQNFLSSVRGEGETSSPFKYGAHLTSMILLGDLAIKAGEGQKLEWDGKKMECTNKPEMNQFLKREYREGWKV